MIKQLSTSVVRKSFRNHLIAVSSTSLCCECSLIYGCSRKSQWRKKIHRGFSKERALGLSDELLILKNVCRHILALLQFMEVGLNCEIFHSIVFIKASVIAHGLVKILGYFSSPGSATTFLFSEFRFSLLLCRTVTDQ